MFVKLFMAVSGVEGEEKGFGFAAEARGGAVAAKICNFVCLRLYIMYNMLGV